MNTPSGITASIVHQHHPLALPPVPFSFFLPPAREGAARGAFTLLKTRCLHGSFLNSSDTSISAWSYDGGSTGHLAEAAEPRCVLQALCLGLDTYGRRLYMRWPFPGLAWEPDTSGRHCYFVSLQEMKVWRCANLPVGADMLHRSRLRASLLALRCRGSGGRV